MDRNEHRLMNKFFILSVILFVVILFAGGVAFVFSMRQIITANKEKELSRMLEVERIRLETSVNSEITLALKLANSPLIVRYFLNPEDQTLEKDAFEEIASYRKAFLSNSIFWVNNKDKIFYSDNFQSYLVDTESPENYWYNMTLYETEVYNFNINYNPDLNTTNLWINAPVFDDDGVPVGIVGTYIVLSNFIESVYKDFDERAELYFFNRQGEVTGARDISLVESKGRIEDYMPGMDARIFSDAVSIAPGETRTYKVKNGDMAVNTIPVLDWHSAVFMENSIYDYNTAMTFVFLVMVVVILLIIIIFNVFVRRFLKSLHQTTESLEYAKGEAVAANESKSTVLTMLSREIGIPLGEAIGAIELRMLRSDMPPDMSVWLGRLLEGQRGIRKRLDAIVGDESGASENDLRGSAFEFTDTQRTGSAVASNPGGTRHLFVINPKSFVTLGDLKDFLLSIEGCFSVGRRAEYKVYISRFPRDAYSAVHRFLLATPQDETARVYAVGGDGILFDCLNGLAQFPNAELAPIPYGNANDFVRSFGADNIDEFRNIGLMCKAPSRLVDMMLCGNQYALCSCSIGIEAKAVQVFSNIIERINFGKARYFVPLLYKLGAVKSLFDGSQNNMNYKVMFDNEDFTGDYLFINVGNIALNGGSNIPNPHSVPDDGILDVIACKSSSAMHGLRMLPAYTSGQYEKFPDQMKHYRLKEMYCESEKLMSVILDGETFYTHELDLKILPKAVKIVAPDGIGFADYSGIAEGGTK